MCAEGHYHSGIDTYGKWSDFQLTKSESDWVLSNKKERKKKKMISGQTNWSAIINMVGEEEVRDFAEGKLSAESFYEGVVYSDVAGEVRRLLRERGATYARRLARKALSRR